MPDMEWAVYPVAACVINIICDVLCYVFQTDSSFLDTIYEAYISRFTNNSSSKYWWLFTPSVYAYTLSRAASLILTPNMDVPLPPRNLPTDLDHSQSAWLFSL